MPAEATRMIKATKQRYDDARREHPITKYEKGAQSARTMAMVLVLDNGIAGAMDISFLELGQLHNQHTQKRYGNE